MADEAIRFQMTCASVFFGACRRHAFNSCLNCLQGLARVCEGVRMMFYCSHMALGTAYFVYVLPSPISYFRRQPNHSCRMSDPSYAALHKHHNVRPSNRREWSELIMMHRPLVDVVSGICESNSRKYRYRWLALLHLGSTQVRYREVNIDRHRLRQTV